MNSHSPQAGSERKQQRKKRVQSMVTVCPACRSAVTHENPYMVEKSAEVTLGYGVCPSCEAAMFILEVEEGKMLTSIGIATELSQQEIQRLWSAPTVTEDDVLAVHAALQNSEFTQQFLYDQINKQDKK